MPRTNAAILLLASIVLSACSADGASQGAVHKYPTINGVRQLSGDEASSLVSGNTVVGYYETSSGNYADFFSSDGRFASSSFDDGMHQGRWTIKRDRVCIALAEETPSPNRCITFMAIGDQYVALRPGGKGAYRITGIKSGNFKHLPLE